MSAVKLESHLEPLLDYETLVTRCLGQRELANRLLHRFLEGFDKSLGYLHACAQQRDYAALAAEAHRWKGACLSVSAQSLASLLAELELAARRRHELQVATFVNEAHSTAFELRRYIENLLAQEAYLPDATVTSRSSPGE